MCLPPKTLLLGHRLLQVDSQCLQFVSGLCIVLVNTVELQPHLLVEGQLLFEDLPVALIVERWMNFELFESIDGRQLGMDGVDVGLEIVLVVEGHFLAAQRATPRFPFLQPRHLNAQ